MNQKRKNYGPVLIAALWLGLCLGAWLLPGKEISESERRKLAQFPEITAESILSGDFMADFESYTLDQFPLRDTFRRLKAVFHYYALGQRDNNGIFLYDGYAAQMEYPVNETSVRKALDKFRGIYDSYLKETGAKVYAAVVPDKTEYLPKSSGYLTLDSDRMFSLVRDGMSYAAFIDLRDQLSMDSYYRTDTHWRQERILKAAQELCAAMGVTGPREEDFSPRALERPFYGVYYGQAALPMDPETVYVMESDWLKDCTVTNLETGKTAAIYDMEKLDSRDLYDVYLSGAVSLLTIENPHGIPGKELIVFRDSFGSSMIPLLIRDYATVTVVDIRYIASNMLSSFVDFRGQDTLFLYSTLILNNSTTLK